VKRWRYASVKIRAPGIDGDRPGRPPSAPCQAPSNGPLSSWLHRRRPSFRFEGHRVVVVEQGYFLQSNDEDELNAEWMGHARAIDSFARPNSA